MHLVWMGFLAGCGDLSDDARTAQEADLCLSARPDPVFVKGGAFEFGGRLYPEEGPIAERTVGAFEIDATEVTNASFAAFIEATGYVTRAERGLDETIAPGLPPSARQPGSMVFAPFVQEITGFPASWWVFVPGANWRRPYGPDSDLEGREHHPVVHVTLEDAEAYAKWQGRDLPNEVEWEYAARNEGKTVAARTGTSPASANVWQGLFPVQNLKEDGFSGTAPVGCFEATENGLYDTVGNVWELTRSVYYPTHTPAGLKARYPSGVSSSTGDAPVVVIKGGSHLCSESYCMRYRAESRQPQDRYLGTSHVGFRTIKRLSGTATN